MTDPKKPPAMALRFGKRDREGRYQPEPSEDLEFQNLGLCICGQQIGINYETQCVAHFEPRCAEYNRMEPLEFLQWVRKKKGIPDDT